MYPSITPATCRSVASWLHFLVPALLNALCAYGASDTPSIETVKTYLRQSVEQRPDTAIGITITRVFTHGKEETVRRTSARIAQADDRFFLDTSQIQVVEGKPIEESKPARFGFSWDGQQLYLLKGTRKELLTLTQDEQWRQPSVASLIAQPFRMLDSDRFWDPQSVDLFEADSVKQITSEGPAVVVTVDGTRKSDFEEIVYRLRPDLQWAVEQIEYYSGGQKAAEITASDFFQPGQGNSWCPGRLVYKRAIDDSPMGLTSAEALITPLQDFNLTDSASFRLAFPPEAISHTERAAAKVCNDILSTVQAQTTAASSAPNAAASCVATAQSTAPDPTAAASESSKDISHSTDGKTWQSRLILPLILLSLLMSAVVAAAIAKIRRGHQVTLTVAFQIMVCVALLLITFAFSVGTVLHGGARKMIDNQDAQGATSASPADPTSSIWQQIFYCDLPKREYHGRVNLNPAASGSAFLSYTGSIERKAGTEVHEFQAGPMYRRIVTEADWNRQYSGDSDKPVMAGWAPTIYSILNAYRSRTGRTVQLGADASIDLSDAKFRNLDGEPARQIVLRKCCASADSLTYVLTVEGKTALISSYLWNEKNRSVTENCKYFDVNGLIVLDWESTYTL